MASGGGFGTRNYFIPNAGMTPQSAQILNGTGYVTVNIKGAHYRSSGNLWQQIFGGSDKVTLTTQVSHILSSAAGPAATNPTGASIEDVRQISTGQPYYFGSGRAIALDLPADCDAIEISASMSAIRNDNLSGALNILNSGELKSTLQLAPPQVSGALAVAGIVKKLLTNTDPQNTLQAEYDGRVSVSHSDDPIRDFCLAQGTLILIYRESADDTSLDDLDPALLTTAGDGLKYNGAPLQNTYVMFQISFTDLRGEDSTSQWYGAFSTASQTLDGLITATSDTDKQKLWASAYATYQQGVKLLTADPTYTRSQAEGIAAKYLMQLQGKYTHVSGQPQPPAPAPFPKLLVASQSNFLSQLRENPEAIAKEYMAKLARSRVSLAGPLR
jgi:hypothetical protein